MGLLPIYALMKFLRRRNALAIFSYSHDVNGIVQSCNFLAERLLSDITVPKRRKLVLVPFK